MSVHGRNILADVAAAYVESRSRFESRMARGDHEGADEFMSEMQEIERCVHVNELNTGWRRTLATRRQREAAAR